MRLIPSPLLHYGNGPCRGNQLKTFQWLTSPLKLMTLQYHYTRHILGVPSRTRQKSSSLDNFRNTATCEPSGPQERLQI